MKERFGSAEGRDEIKGRFSSSTDGLGLKSNKADQSVPPEFSMIPGLTDTNLRLECLKAANDTARLGLAHNVYQTAERYVAWVKGEQLEDPNAGLDFRQRLEGLVTEFLREERSDPRRIMNDVEEWFHGFEQQYPEPIPVGRLSDVEVAAYGEVFAKAADVVWPATPPTHDVPPMVHKDIRS